MSQKRPMHATWSLISVEVLAVLTSVHHLDELGIVFLVPALIITIVPVVLIWQWMRTPRRSLRWAYAIFVVLLVLGFGLYDGFVNHTMKMLIFFATGSDRSLLAKSYPIFPPIGSAFHEITGVLAFVATLFAVYVGYRFLVTGRNTAQSEEKAA